VSATLSATPVRGGHIAASAFSSFVRRRPAVWDAAFISVVAAAGMVLALQGWRVHAPAFDMLTYFYGVDAFLERGVILDHGNLSSYGPFFPPGPFWLMLPGRLLLTDPRLFEKVGGAILYVGTLAGIFVFARTAFAARCARWCVVLYGLSGIGLAFAGSLWPIGNPFFFVWTAYFATRWAVRKDARYLSAAGLVWLLGMYVGMALAPAGLIIPIVWLAHRPPVWSRAVLVSAVVVVAVWWPYLGFESGRAFIDIRSLLLLQDINPTNYQASWCDPGLTLNTVGSSIVDGEVQAAPPPPPTLTPAQRVLRRAGAIVDGLLANFNDSAGVWGVGPVLLLMALGGMLEAWRSRAKNARLLVLTLLVPWTILVLVAEPGKTERFLWLWPLQVIVVTALVTDIIPRLRLHRPLVWLAQLAALLLLLGSPVLSRLDAWSRTGWAGTDAAEVQAVDYVASYLRAEGQDHVAIGYETFIYPFMARYHAIDPQYKVGAEFDALFKYRYGIVNVDQCAEGLSGADQYRIVQAWPQGTPGAPIQYFDVQRNGTFRGLGRVASYDVFRRD
jgi:hypothetical protein